MIFRTLHIPDHCPSLRSLRSSRLPATHATYFDTMDSSYDACRALLPSPYELYQPNRTASAVGTSSLNPSLDDPIPAPRRPKAGIKTAQQWQEQAAIIQMLYEIDGLTLEATMKSMNENHGFQAS